MHRGNKPAYKVKPHETASQTPERIGDGTPVRELRDEPETPRIYITAREELSPENLGRFFRFQPTLRVLRVRVISGVARGRNLLAPKNMRVRPTSDRVKEALFNILVSRMGEFDGMRVLDIFAGTGNLGIEALSRGAESAVFIDSHPESVQLIRKNLELTRLATKAQVVVQDAAVALKILAKREAPFHLIFLDPPYRLGQTHLMLELLAGSNLVAPGSVVVAEFSAKEEVPQSFGCLQERDRRVYGDTALSFLTLSERGEQCP